MIVTNCGHSFITQKVRAILPLVKYAEHCTSIELLEIDPAMPFSLVMLFELLLGELGPEPGALLHADSERKWAEKT